MGVENVKFYKIRKLKNVFNVWITLMILSLIVRVNKEIAINTVILLNFEFIFNFF